MKNKIYVGDCVEVMKLMPDNYIDMVLTSPEYDKVRTFHNNPKSFNFKGVVNQLLRILKPGGVVVWVVDDGTENFGETGTNFRQALYFQEIGFTIHDTMIFQKDPVNWCPNHRRYKQSSSICLYSQRAGPKQ